MLTAGGFPHGWVPSRPQIGTIQVQGVGTPVLGEEDSDVAESNEAEEEGFTCLDLGFLCLS